MVVFVQPMIAFIQPMAVAQSKSELKTIAHAVTVEIKLQQQGSSGSGVIINRLASSGDNSKGDLYTLVTNNCLSNLYDS
jgi:hypothetical protein